jgi:DNA-3-methyladenine glycosylase I
MAEELRACRQERHDGRLIDISPGGTKPADHKVELISKESVMRIGDEVHGQGGQGRRGRNETPVRRCPWASTPDLIAYHDEEWGVPLHDDSSLFELLVLEGAQAGLSWETVLRKRARYRELFGGFDPPFVARISAARVEKFLLDPGIIRHRGKLESAIGNARAVLKVRDEFGSFDAYVWRFVGGKPVLNRWRRAASVPASTTTSAAMSTDLSRRGFRFVGPTICYAFMQACGMINDHLLDCDWRLKAV